MANTDRPNGFVPIGTISGSPYSGYIRAYEADASAGAIFLGDMVILEADGKVAPAAAGSTQLLGACVGFLEHMPIKVDGVTGNFLSTSALDHVVYKPASTAGVVLVAVGPDVLYEVQEDGDTSDLAVTDIGSNIDLIAGSGSTTTGRSGFELNSDTVTAAGSAQFRIIDMVDRPDNELGDWARWIVRIHESHLAQTNGV